ncbi:MAG: ribosomal protein [Bacteroidetes bacterium]|jgi:small subunit ribosomal protein S9|nr:ribosomal protein [Bacteroidota bacterium]
MHAHTITAVGRRKTSVARVFLTPGTGKVTINRRPVETYFPLEMLRVDALKPFEVTQTAGKFDVRVRVEGGGPTGQAGAVRLGIARALVTVSEEHKTTLRAAGMVTRDPRMVERKKYGQRKARKRFQFSKR